MSPKLNNMFVRALTGIVYVALLVGSVIYGPLTMFLFFTLVSAAATWEFATLMNRHNGLELNRPILSIASVLLGGAIWCYQMQAATAGQLFALYGFTMLYLLVSELYRQAPNPLANWAFSFASQFYVALPLALPSLISVGTDTYHWIFILATFVFLWINDTGAYLTGSALHNVFPAKLFERISPNKSWVGSIGGGILTVLVSLAFAHYDPTLTRLQWAGMALVVVVFGTWGDLVESLLKRQLGIKDSGKVLPGHGGMLDRFDSALLSIPAVVLYFIFIG